MEFTTFYFEAFHLQQSLQSDVSKKYKVKHCTQWKRVYIGIPSVPFQCYAHHSQTTYHKKTTHHIRYTQLHAHHAQRPHYTQNELNTHIMRILHTECRHYTELVHYTHTPPSTHTYCAHYTHSLHTIHTIFTCSILIHHAPTQHYLLVLV